MGQCVDESSLLLATGLDPEDVIVDGSQVFFTNTGDDSIRSISLAGGTVSTLATGQARPLRIASDGTSLYWSSYLGGAVLTMPENGTGTPTVVAAASNPWGIAVDATYVYWADQGSNSLMRVAKTGGAATPIASGFLGAPQEVGLGGGAVAVGDTGSGCNAFGAPSGMGGLGPCGDGPAVAIGGGLVYDLGGTLTWSDLATGRQFDVFATTLRGGRALAGDECGAYAGAGNGFVGIEMLQHNGSFVWGRLFPVATTTGTPHRIAITQDYMVWSYAGTNPPTSHDGAIYRMSKPR